MNKLEKLISLSADIKALQKIEKQLKDELFKELGIGKHEASNGSVTISVATTYKIDSDGLEAIAEQANGFKRVLDTMTETRLVKRTKLESGKKFDFTGAVCQQVEAGTKLGKLFEEYGEFDAVPRITPKANK